MIRYRTVRTEAIPQRSAPKPAPLIFEVKPEYLVVRVSFMDGKDVLAELDRVIEQRGYAWFGKYGRPLGTGATKHTRFLVLAARNPHAGLLFRTYTIEGFSLTRPKSGAYPAYYSDYLRRIRSWVRIVPAAEAHQVALGELLVSSSATDLRNALSRSMSSHFICGKRPAM